MAEIGEGISISFPDWGISTLHKLLKAVGVGGLVATAIAIHYLEPGRWPALWFTPGGLEKFLTEKLLERANLAFVQALVCLLLAALTPKTILPVALLKKNKARVDIARRACFRIRRLVVFLFSLWSAYYVITGLKFLSAYHGHPTDLVDRAFLITLSGLTSICLFWLYLEIGEITIEKSSDDQPHLDASVYKTMAVGFFITVMSVLWYGFATGNEVVIGAIDLIVACLSGIGLCFVVGRFADKLINPGALALFFLYLYAVIQLGAAIMQKEPVVHLVITTMALPLKLLLWLVCVWAFTTGILGEYLYEMRILIERVDALRSREDEAQEEIL
jgi:hypothetical protein